MLQIIITIKLKQSTQTKLMMTENIVKSIWAEDMGQFLYHLDPNTRKITRRLEKLQLKIINKQRSIVFNKTCLNNNLLPKYTLFDIYLSIYIYIYIYWPIDIIARGFVNGSRDWVIPKTQKRGT